MQTTSRATPALFNLRHLRAFIATAQSGGVSRAAAQLLRAQSVVTRAIHKLEEAIDAPLFERRAKGVELTVYGRALLFRAQRAAGELEQACVDMQPLTGRDPPSPTAPVFSMQTSVRHLSAFLLLVEVHRMQEVASRLGISQPAVSAAIRAMEGGLRTALFIRAPAGLYPNPAARALAHRVKLAFAELRHAEDELAALRGEDAGHVRVGVLPLSRTAIVIPRAIARLVARYPRMHVALRDGAFDTQEDALRSGELDFIFGALRDFTRDPELVCEAFFEDRLALIVRKGHPLAGIKRLPIARLRENSWVLNRPDTPGRDRLEAAFRTRGMAAPRVVVETGSLAMTRALLLETDFITALSPDQFEREIAAAMLAVLPIEFPETARPIGVIRRRTSVLPPSAERLIQSLREVCHAM